MHMKKKINVVVILTRAMKESVGAECEGGGRMGW